MVETLFRAEEELTGEVLVCYADIIYEKKIIQKLLESEADIGVTIDEDYWDYWEARLDKPEEDMESLILNDQDKIIDLGNTECGKENDKTRYVGLIKFSRKGVESLKKVYHKNKEIYFDKDEKWMRSKSFKKAYMTCMLQALINEGYDVEPIKIKRGWMEFDTNEDYENANLWLMEDSLGKFINLDN